VAVSAIDAGDTFYIAPRASFIYAPEAAFLVFAATYFALEQARRGRHRRLLGQLHFWTTFVGVNLFLLPVHVLPLAAMPRRFTDYPDAFSTWNDISAIGWVATLAAQLFFVAVVIDAFRREPIPG
jgi:cytochrome c oxidase subunit I